MAGGRAARDGRPAVKSSRPSIFLAVRLLLGTAFLYAGTIKALDVTGFARQVAAYQIMPYAFNDLAAAILPYVEILCGALLLCGLRVRPALLVLGGMNLCFMIALLSVMLRGMDIDCGCFNSSGGSHTGAGVALVRDLVLMMLIVTAWFLQKAGSCQPRI
jgi:uncharacterized membrane protein YphA (DoxX/SURF4 family)